jgi:hypothetical protein
VVCLVVFGLKVLMQKVEVAVQEHFQTQLYFWSPYIVIACCLSMFVPRFNQEQSTFCLTVVTVTGIVVGFNQEQSVFCLTVGTVT